MYYFCKKSKQKIIHTRECFCIQDVGIDTIGWFETLSEAYEAGYRLCKHCSILAKSYRKECSAILKFCQENGLVIHMGAKCIVVFSHRSRWKLTIGEKNRMVLYHKNTFQTDRDCLSAIKGYHLQGDVLKEKIVDYLDYIVEHDYFRMVHPAQQPKKNAVSSQKEPPRKGTRRYRSMVEREKQRGRKTSIANVLKMIDGLATQSRAQVAMP